MKGERHANSNNQKKAGIVTLISDRTDFRAKKKLSGIKRNIK